MEQRQSNTDLGVAPRETQHTYWCFTFNNYSVEQVEQMEQILRHECRWYVFQEEVGRQGTEHLQGTICLKVKQRLTQMKKINPKIHWEATKSVSASIAYCTKAATATGKIYTHGIDVPEQLDVDEPRGWQTEVVDIISSKPDKRTIHWFWEPNGNVGKTTLCKWLVVKRDALMLTGKSADMFHMLAKYPKKRKVIVVDVPRSSLEYINYGAIEMVKNGLVFSGKYDSAQLVFNCPHVIVFANEPPKLENLSQDRWHVVRITKGL